MDCALAILNYPGNILNINVDYFVFNSCMCKTCFRQWVTVRDGALRAKKVQKSNQQMRFLAQLGFEFERLPTRHAHQVNCKFARDRKVPFHIRSSAIDVLVLYFRLITTKDVRWHTKPQQIEYLLCWRLECRRQFASPFLPCVVGCRANTASLEYLMERRQVSTYL